MVTRTRKLAFLLVALAVIVAHAAILGTIPSPSTTAAHTRLPDKTEPDSWVFETRTIHPPRASAVTNASPVPVHPTPRASLARSAPKKAPNHETGLASALDPVAVPAAVAVLANVAVPADIVVPGASEFETIAVAVASPSAILPKIAPANFPAEPLAPTARANPPATVRLKYDVRGEIKGFAYFVNGELTWINEGGTYSAKLEISHFLLGSRIQTSKGLLSSHGLEPVRFGDKVRSEVAAHFNRAKNIVTFSANTPDVPLTRGAQDQLSVFLQIAALLAAEPEKYPTGSTLRFQAVGARHSEVWDFTMGETETLQLPGGSLLAIKLVKNPTGEYDSRAELWLAPDMEYLPVRIRLTQANGDMVDQLWRATERPVAAP
jgi:hypothetical protein